LVLTRGAVFIGKRREDPVPELRRELQRAGRSSELVRKGPRGLLLVDQRLAAGSASRQMSLRRSLRPRREAPVHVFVDIAVETAAVHCITFF
jgi:hypothetical protein